MDAYTGEIRAFGFNFPPVSWAMCTGQLVPIQQNAPLFSLLGTAYGGDGRTNFGLPNLQGNTVIGTGTGPGLAPRVLGAAIGSSTVTVATNQIPPHNHTMSAFFPATLDLLVPTPVANARLSYADRTAPTPTTVLYAFSSSTTPNTTLAPQSLSPVGGGQPSSNAQPYVVVNFCICTQGEWPPHQ
jgi:microcystin-dependent protein